MITRQTLAGGIVALLLVGGGCASAPADSSPKAAAPAVEKIAGWTYYDQKTNLNFQMQLPADWEKDETPDGKDVVTAFYSPFEDDSDSYRDNVVITALQVPDDVEISAEEFAEQSHAGLKKSVEKLELKDAGSATISGISGKKYTFTGQLNAEGNRVNLKGEEYFIVYNQRAYNFTFGAAASKFDKLKPIFDQILGAIEIK